MSPKAQTALLDRLIKQHSEIVGRLDNEVYPLIEKIEKENDGEIYREGRVLMTIFHDTRDNEPHKVPRYACSHKEIDAERERYFGWGGNQPSADQAEAYHATTRELHALLELDMKRQAMFRKHIGLSGAEALSAQLGSEAQTIVNKILAYRPASSSALARKVEIVSTLLSTRYVDAQEDNLFSLLASDVERLFLPKKTPAKRVRS